MRIKRLNRRLLLGLGLALGLSALGGCATVGTNRVAPGSNDIEKAAAEIPDAQLLDVWIEIFQPGELPDGKDKAVGLSMEIREAEARFIPVHLRNTMEKTGYWGAVRVVPRDTEGAEVLVRGKILQSDGETLELEITALDATGRQWFSETYRSRLKSEDRGSSVGKSTEVFQSLYNAVANNLARYRAQLSADELVAIRRVARLRFAADLVPDAFTDYLRRDEEGRYTVLRLPARDDPIFQRVEAVRERDLLLMDTLNGHFDNFYGEMRSPYDEWRKARSEEAAALRKIKRQATTRKLLGAAAIVGAIAMSVFGNSSTDGLRGAMVVGGAYAVKSGMDKDAESTIHREAIEELGNSFESEAQPLVVEVEGRTHELTGSAEVQYTRWRALLRQIYATETGLVEVTY